MGLSGRGASLLGALALLPAVASANPADLFGLGGASMARSGAGLALDGDAHAAWRNPAALGLAPFGEVTVGGHLGSMQFPCFVGAEVDGACTPGILWDANRDGVLDPANPQDRWHPDESDYLNPAGVRLGVLIPALQRLRFALSVSLPGNRLVLIRQEDPYLPHYVRWRNRPHRLSLAAGASAELVPGLHIGAAVSVLATAKLDLGFQVTARASDDDLSDDGTDGSLQVDFVVNPSEISVDVRPALAPIAAVTWDLGGIAPPLAGLRLAAVYRHPVKINIDPTRLHFDLFGVADDVGELGDVLIPVQAEVAFSILDFSTPRQVALGVAWSRPRFQVTAETTWSQWSDVLPNVARIDEDNTDAAIGLVDLQAHIVNARDLSSVAFRDAWALRLGGELRPPPLPLRGALRALRELGVTVRAGYAYEPSFVPDQTGLTNFLDNPTHVISGGLGLRTWDPTGLFSGPLSVDLFAQAQVLQPRQHEKESTAPAPGAPTDGVVRTGGLVWVAGGDVTLRF